MASAKNYKVSNRDVDGMRRPVASPAFAAEMYEDLPF